MKNLGRPEKDGFFSCIHVCCIYIAKFKGIKYYIQKGSLS